MIGRKVQQTVDDLDHSQLELLPHTQQTDINNFHDRLILYLAPTYEREMYKYVKMNYQTNFTNQIAAASYTGDKLKGGTQYQHLLQKLERDLELKNESLMPQTRFTNEANVNEYLGLVVNTAQQYLTAREAALRANRGNVQPSHKYYYQRED